MIAGVCGGLGDYFDIDPVFVRVAFVALAFLHGVGILAYIILAVVTPEDKTVAKQSTSPGEQDLTGSGDVALDDEDTLRYYSERRVRGRNFLALGLIVVGGLFLVSNLGLLWWVNFNLFWPLVLVAVGVLLLMGQIRR
jgi:phage shock protein PspC (stress-responsive transcriptional regulator)